MKQIALILSVVSFSFISFSGKAQEIDTLKREKKHSVTLAAVLSAALPGAGQVYNHIAMPKGKKKAYWKVPLIYAALGTTTYFLISNQSKVNALRKEYLGREESGLLFIDPAYQQYDNNAILTLHNQHQTNRDLMILATAGVYIINILDAAVEAHFVNFDISEDLTLKIRPTVMQGYSPGLSLRFNFR